MNKTLLILSIFLSINIISFSQISINVVNSQTDISGNSSNPYNINLDPSNNELVNFGFFSLDLELQNNTGITKSWRVTRKKLNVAQNCLDQLAILGSNYDPIGDVWMTPSNNAITLNNSEKTTLNIHYFPGDAGDSHYRYYIGDGTNFEDSVDIKVIYTLPISINVLNSQTDISGNSSNPYTINLDPTNHELTSLGYFILDLELQNKTGIAKTWRITRKKLNVAQDWLDQICIPGNCYDPFGDVWSTPANNPIVLNNTEKALLNLHFTPGSSAGNSIYRYYIGNGTTYEDSVDIKLSYTLGVKANKQNTTFSIGPNPASEQVIISTNSNELSTVKIIDVLGNNVYSESISGNKKIDVSDFKNGIYFISIESSETKISNRKLIIRH